MPRRGLPQKEHGCAAFLKKLEFMPVSCPQCAVSMPDDAACCPDCGHAMRLDPDSDDDGRAHGTVGGLPETLAGALAYFLLPAIIFLLVPPYSKNRFVRFHSFQCLGLCLAALVIGALLRAAGFALFFIPTLGRLLVVLFSMVIVLAFFAVWVVLIVKALQGEMFKLPGVGHFAERHTPED
jgi:uncharacterized membrane protein